MAPPRRGRRPRGPWTSSGTGSTLSNMMRRVAVLSDVHAVAQALEAVLNEPEVAKPDRVVFTGDLLPGPLPRQSLDLVAALGDRALWLRGNGERDTLRLRQPEPPRAKTPHPVVRRPGHRGRPRRVGGPPSGGVAGSRGAGVCAVLSCHAARRRRAGAGGLNDDRWREVLAGVTDPGSVVVCGHTHMPFVRLVDGRMVLNPGSVGMPCGPPGAHWSLLGPGVQLRRTVLDARAVRATVERGSDFPGVGAWIEPYLTGGITDAGAKRRMRAQEDRRAEGG